MSAVLLLAFDTATAAVCTALVRDGEPVAEVVSLAPGAAARRVLADIDDVLDRGQARLADLDGLVVGTGPGSFTGIRIGLATAAALGDAVDLPLAGVSTLRALLALAPAGAVAVIDAARREVFASGPGIGAAAIAPAGLADRLGPGAVCVGDGALRYRALLEAAGASVPTDEGAHVPMARAHAALARFDGSMPATPCYLREPDALTLAARR